jgi:hypothetical protein
MSTNHLGILFAFGLLLAPGKIVFAEDLRLGVFEIDASPAIGSPLAYDPVKEIETPLTCKGVVILGDQPPVVIAVLDWIGIGNGSHRMFREQIAEACRTTMDRVTVHTIHQHDAPWCDDSMASLLAQASVTGHPFDTLFTRQIIEKTASAAREAIHNAKLITHIGLSAAKVDRVASNRRILGPDGKVLHVRWTATVDPEVRAYPEGTIDPLLKMITFWNNQERLAVLTYYATHPQSYYRTGKANPDFPGLARNARQRETGVTHIHFNGAGGNIGAGKYNDGNPANRQVLAGRMEDAMKRAWESADRTPIAAADVDWNSVPVALPVSPHFDRATLEKSFTDPKMSITQKLSAAGKLAWAGRMEQGDTMDIGCLRLGTAQVLHMPGELFVEYQLKAHEMAPSQFVCMAAYGDYGPAYIGTSIAYEQGGYETGPDASFVAPGVEEILMRAISELLTSKSK